MRKQHTIFSLIYKTVLINVINFACAFLFTTNLSFAQDNKDTTVKIVQLKEINVYGDELVQTDALQSNLLKNNITKKNNSIHSITVD